jgi:hypothetical protein
MVEEVHRLEAQNQRGPSVLLHDHGRKQRRLEAVCRASLDDAAKGAKCLAGFLGVVRQGVQIPLHGQRCGESSDEAPLSRRERSQRRSAVIS